MEPRQRRTHQCVYIFCKLAISSDHWPCTTPSGRLTTRVLSASAMPLSADCRCPGQEPAEAAQTVSFAHCQHNPADRACWTCLEAVSAELTSRWARLFHKDKTAANRLRRVCDHWQRFYDPCQFKTQIKGREIAVIRLTMETREERSIRLARQRIERKTVHTLRQRGFPKSCAIGSTGQQSQHVIVVSPVI